MSCESFEIEVSALADGELESERLLSVIDHVVACDACRRFYQDARTLDTLVAPQQAAANAPREMWERIAHESGIEPRRSTKWPLPRWALAAAASVAGALALWVGLQVASTARTPDQVDVALSGKPGVMSERRFVQLTVELLEADPRYRRAMLAVLREVGTEASAEDRSTDVFVGRDDQTEYGDVVPSVPSSRPGTGEAAGAARL